MIKKILISSMTVSMMLFLLSACAEDDQATTSAQTTPATPPKAQEEKPVTRPAATTPKPPAQEEFQSAAIMSQPVDFSSAEQVTASMNKIQQDAGDQAAGRVQNAIEYMLVYDLGVGRNKDKLYKKLNGKTPNEILAMTGR